MPGNVVLILVGCPLRICLGVDLSFYGKEKAAQ